jgi:DNA-binding SARP family transcriptional activator/tetratricopeptide (TPR) repeat protein
MARSSSASKPKRGQRATPSPRVAVPAAPLLTIRLLGGFEVRAADGAIVSFATRKAEALIALLAMRPGQLWSRDQICALLWPDVREAQARHSLRQTLLSVSKALPLPVLETRARTLCLDPQAVDVDAAELAVRLSEESAEALDRVRALYRGDLLEGLAVPEEPFEAWLRFERERLRSSTAQGLSRLTDLHARAGELGAASEACAQLLRLEPLREEAHRALMRLYLRQGRRSAALQQYHYLARALRSELGSAPEAETEQLFRELSEATSAAGVEPLAALAASDQRTASAGQQHNPGDRLDYVVPLIGRDAELAALAQSHERAQKRRSRVALVLGEAGVGKTRLVERFAAEAEARGVRVLRARCYESEQVLPFSLWSRLLRAASIHEDESLRAELPARVRAELSQLLPELCGDSAEEPAPARDALSLFQALRWLLSRLGQAAPLVLVLDDLHWGDEMSLRALCFLSHPDQASRPCLFVATAREEEVAGVTQFARAVLELDRDRLLTRIQLTPLSRADTVLLTERLAAAQALAPLQPELVERIWSISEGNPLVVVESARALAEGAIAQDVAALPVPERVRALILSRAARTSALARELLCIAAVIGRELPLELLRRPGVDDAARVDAIEELVEARFLRAEDERLYFTHDRMRETIYEDLLPARRRLLHGSVAQALAELHQGQLDEVVGLLGYHHSKAGNVVQSVPLLLRFSERAWRLHGLGDALAALEQALADSARLPPPERAPAAIAIVIRQAMCLAFLGRLDKLIERLASHEAALASLDQPTLAGPFYFWWGFAESLIGKRDVAQEYAERALAQAASCQDRRIIAYSHSLLSYLCSRAGAFDQGVQHGIKGMSLLSPDLDIPEAIVISALNLTINYLARGDWQDAMVRMERAYAMACAAQSRRGQALAAAGIAAVFTYTEDWESALEYCGRAVQASQDPFTLVHALSTFGRAQIGSGRPDLAIAVLERAVAELEPQRLPSYLGVALLRLSEAQLAAGQTDSAILNATKALAPCEQSEDVLIVGLALRTLARVELALGRLEPAREHLAAALELFQRCAARIEIGHTLHWQAKLEGRAGEHSLARALHTRARAELATRNVERIVARLDREAAELWASREEAALLTPR